MTRKILLQGINIPENNIHRIRGEDNPSTEWLQFMEDCIGFLIMKQTGYYNFDF